MKKLNETDKVVCLKDRGKLDKFEDFLKCRSCNSKYYSYESIILMSNIEKKDLEIQKDGVDLYKGKELKKRINIQKKYSKADLDGFIKKKLNIKNTESILDVCCGNGNHLELYKDFTPYLYGIDLSLNLLVECSSKFAKSEYKPILIQCDVDNMPIVGSSFDIITCNFAIYYTNIKNVLYQIRDILKNGGRFLIIVPDKNNAIELLEIHKSLTNYIPDLYDSAVERTDSELLPQIKNLFNNVNVELFENEIVYPNGDEFKKYYISTTLYQKTVVNDLSFKDKVENKYRDYNSPVKITKRSLCIMGNVAK